MAQRVNIAGVERLTAGMTTQVSPGGLLALPSNIGFRERNVFAAIPELTAETRWQSSCGLELSLGYSFIFYSDVMQAGEVIDRTVNGSQTSGGTLVGDARPAFAFQDGTYWVHGVSLGLMWRH